MLVSLALRLSPSQLLETWAAVVVMATSPKQMAARSLQIETEAQRELKDILNARPDTTNFEQSISNLRHFILREGVPAAPDGSSPMRTYVWSILLGVGPMSTDEYLLLVEKSASDSYGKIRNDTFRTMATDPLFRNKVSEPALIRVLNAFAWRAQESSVTYVQGMNMLAAPFLYACKSEVEAFALFERFITSECPLYVKPALEGVHMGLKLLDLCLQRVEPKLYKFLMSKALQAELYAFPCMSYHTLQNLALTA